MKNDIEMLIVTTLAAYGLMKMCESLLFEQKTEIRYMIIDKSELEKESSKEIEEAEDELLRS